LITPPRAKKCVFRFSTARTLTTVTARAAG
jgi:hypothetical protein